MATKKAATLATFQHVVAETAAKNQGRMFCTRKGITLADCPCEPKCVFLKKYTKDVWV